jgi:hypothetical protein
LRSSWTILWTSFATFNWRPNSLRTTQLEFLHPWHTVSSFALPSGLKFLDLVQGGRLMRIEKLKSLVSLLVISDFHFFHFSCLSHLALFSFLIV